MLLAKHCLFIKCNNHILPPKWEIFPGHKLLRSPFISSFNPLLFKYMAMFLKSEKANVADRKVP